MFFDNVAVTSKTGPAIYCQGANKLIITLLPGTENRISDSGSYRADAELEACIYSECDLTINGTGELVVNGYYKDAIQSKDIVKILDGVDTIKCKRTGIHGNDGILISGGEFSIIAGRYAFVAAKADLLVYNCTVFERNIVNTYDVGGTTSIQEGCVQS